MDAAGAVSAAFWGAGVMRFADAERCAQAGAKFAQVAHAMGDFNQIGVPSSGALPYIVPRPDTRPEDVPDLCWAAALMGAEVRVRGSVPELRGHDLETVGELVRRVLRAVLPEARGGSDTAASDIAAALADVEQSLVDLAFERRLLPHGGGKKRLVLVAGN